MSIALIFMNALQPQQFKSKAGRWFADPFARACLLFLGFALLSGCWSQDVGMWFASVKNKIPFLVLPFAFIAVPLQQARYRKWLIGGLALMHLLIILYSLIHLGMHWERSVEGYGASQVLPTTRYDDHIRFSISLAFCVPALVHLIRHHRVYACGKGERRFFAFTAAVFVLYLHLLASKTGLLVLYCLMTGLALQLFRPRPWAALLLALLVPALFAGLAYLSIPTFKNRMHYVLWEIREYRSQGRLDYRYSDAGRLISYELSLKLIGEKPWTGTGLGDVKRAMDRQYERFYPEVPEMNRLVPHNQFLFSGTAMGLPMGCSAALLLLSLLRQPKPRSTQHRRQVPYAGITAAAFFIAFMTEAMLEAQFGVFVFLFYCLLWRCWLNTEPGPHRKNPADHGL